MEDNLSIWNKFNQPPPWALKEIKAGRLRGKSDINPLWRCRALTEQFGPCGEGWKFTIDELWAVPGSDNQFFAFAKVSLYIKDMDVDQREPWGEAIPGIGGSMLIAKEKAGLHSNDEAYKMAVTDALGTAAKMIGVAADVYMGLWDGSKYLEKPQKAKSKSKKQAPAIDPDGLATEAQVKKLNTMITKAGLDNIKVKLLLKVSSKKDLSKERASDIIERWDEFVELYKGREDM